MTVIRRSSLHRLLLIGVALVVLDAGASPASAQTCQALPAGLSQRVAQRASTFVQDPNAAASRARDLLDYAVAYGLLGDGGQDLVIVAAATAETNKQTGASGRSGGVASLVEKPNFATFLALAIEKGAVTAGNSDNQLTLSSSFYALGAALAGDTAESYKRLGALTRVGLSTTFDTQPGSESLSNVRKDQLREWTVKVRLTPDRSIRSAEFEKWWDKNVRPALVNRANALSFLGELLANIPTLTSVADEVVDEWSKQLPTAAKSADPQKAVEELFACALQARILQPLAAGNLTLPADVIKKISTEIGPALTTSASALAAADDAVRGYVEEAEGKPTASITFRQYRPIDKTDYAEATFVYSQSVAPMTAAINAGVTHHFMDKSLPNAKTGWKDALIAAALEHSFPSPFLKGTPDLSQATFAIGVRWEHTFEDKSTVLAVPATDVKLFQIRLEIPLTLGASLPISFTSSNDESLVDEEHTWNKGMFFGLTFDMDKFAALAKALAKR